MCEGSDTDFEDEPIPLEIQPPMQTRVRKVYAKRAESSANMAPGERQAKRVRPSAPIEVFPGVSTESKRQHTSAQAKDNAQEKLPEINGGNRLASPLMDQSYPDDAQGDDEREQDELVETWSSDKNKAIFEKNKKSRRKVKYPQATGSRSYVAQLRSFKENNKKKGAELGEELDAVEVFKDCHTSSKRGLSDIAREAIVAPRPEGSRRGTRIPPPHPRAAGPRHPQVIHLDLRTASTSRVQQLRFVQLEQWFPRERDPRAAEGFYTVLHEDFHSAMVRSGITLRPHRVCPLEDIVEAGGEAIRPLLTYLPGLADLLGRSGLYIEAWVREFYASLWIEPDHEYFQFTLGGRPHRLYTSSVRQRLGLLASTTKLHSLCYGTIDPPRRSHGGQPPGTSHVAVCFRPPFGDGSRRTPSELTPVCRLLNVVMRRTLLPRCGYREGLTNLQQWLLSALSSQSEFDVLDVIISEMEDTIADGIKSRRQLPYAHWISYLITRELDQQPHIRELAESTTEFPVYRMASLVDGRHGNRAQRQARQAARPADRDTIDEQDEAIRAVEHSELAQLFAQQYDMTDSSDEDYQPIPQMTPQAHDSEAGGSSSAPPRAQRVDSEVGGSSSAQRAQPMDPQLAQILDRIQQEQQRQARVQEEQNEHMMTVFGQVQARQDQFQQQLLTFQQQSLTFMQHMLQHIGATSFVPPVQQVGPAPTTTLVTPAIQSSGLQGQGHLPAQIASPSLQFPQFFATPGMGQAQGIIAAQQQTPSAPSASQTDSLLVSMTPTTRSLPATFNEIIGQPTQLQVPVTTVAPVTGTIDMSKPPTPVTSEPQTVAAPVAPITTESVSEPQG